MRDAHRARRFAAAECGEQRVDVARDDVAPVLVPRRLVPREKMVQRRTGREIAGVERRDAMPGAEPHCAVCASNRRATEAAGAISSIRRNTWPPWPQNPR